MTIVFVKKIIYIYFAYLLNIVYAFGLKNNSQIMKRIPILKFDLMKGRNNKIYKEEKN